MANTLHHTHGKLMRKATVLALGSVVVTGFATWAHAEVSVVVVDKTFYPAGSMLAYTELELSGEPLAEALGLDLDVLDPNASDQPTRFDYVAGIESYEYSEEAMYALNYQSRMGPHLVNGPRNALRGGDMAGLGRRFAELSASVAYPLEEIPLNLYPISLPYRAGKPEFAGAVDARVVNKDQFERDGAKGKVETVTIDIPAYYRDYATLNWDDGGMIKELEPAAIGGILLKEVMWSQDFLGGMHRVASDEEVEAESAVMDKDGKHALGVSAVDGMNGVILTELSLDKMLLLQTRLGFDGKTLGAKLSPDYNPAKAPVWFPHRVRVDEAERQGVKHMASLQVIEGHSSLRDTWMLLWPTSEYLAFSDQREANATQNPAFRAVFDGAPFEATAKVNTDATPDNDVAGSDAFALSNTLSRVMFRNLQSLHFNAGAGTLVDTWDGKASLHVTTYDAAYTLVALAIFQKAQDALPVGYASAEPGKAGIKTALGKEALALLTQQADFILSHLVGKEGLVSDGATLDAKGKVTPDTGMSLDAQFAVIRGLGAAFSATGEAKYRAAARNVYLAVDKQRFDAKIGTWAAAPGQATEHTPYTAAAIASGLRTAMLQLRNEGSEAQPELELAALVERYAQWFRTVINGTSTTEGMQLAEWLGDSGENLITGQGEDADRDYVAKVTGAGGVHGTAAVMAGKVRVSAGK